MRYDSVVKADRTWEDVLEWMHKEGVNIVGVQMCEEERSKCVEKRAMGERCGCLGPLVR